MRGVYKKLLDTHNEALCKGMEPAKVVNRLVKCGVFQLYDLEHVNSKVTTQEKNEEIISTLQNRSFKDLSQFLCVLASIDHAHYELALRLQPVTRRIVVFSSSPARAAAVVFMMEKYAGARFSKMERVGAGKALVARRARLFPNELDMENAQHLHAKDIAMSSHRTEMCLLFPAHHAPSDSMFALESFFLEGFVSEADVVLMIGVCEGRQERKAVMATEVVESGKRACTQMANVELRLLETYISQALSKQSSEQTWTRVEVDGLVDVEFGVLYVQPLVKDGNELPNLDSARDASLFTSDPLAYRFYALCEEKCPGKSYLLCCGEVNAAEASLASGRAASLGSESISALTCCGVLMETCKYFDNQLD